MLLSIAVYERVRGRLTFRKNRCPSIPVQGNPCGLRWRYFDGTSLVSCRSLYTRSHLRIRRPARDRAQLSHDYRRHVRYSPPVHSSR